MMLGASLLAAGMAGCGPSSPPQLTAADRAAIEANNQAFIAAAKAADWTALGANYTEDAILLPPNSPAVTGREAIAQYFAAFPPIVELTLMNAEVEGGGSIAYARGAYQLTMGAAGQAPIQDAGKYLAIFRKQDDGSWSLYRDMFSSDLPAAPAAPAGSAPGGTAAPAGD
jgi:ketosteroid isomerase-like protein